MAVGLNSGKKYFSQAGTEPVGLRRKKMLQWLRLGEKERKKNASEEVMKRGDYFHGRQALGEWKKLLTREGDFILREDCRKVMGVDVVEMVVSYRWGGIFHNARIRIDANVHFYLDRSKCSAESVTELLYTYWNKGLEVGSTNGKLLHPVPLHGFEIHDADFEWDGRVELGAGAFGRVYKVQWRNGSRGGREVAVKVCEDCVSSTQREVFFHEAKILAMVQKHPCIVELIGMSVLTPPAKMLMGLCGGDLKTFLNQGKKSETKELIHFGLCIVKAMEHLEHLKVLHLDLACRNCLVKLDNAPLPTAVLSDFGLSQLGPTYNIRQSDAISQKWAGPELLAKEAVATTKCDVWSFGIVLWEIWSGAKEPYPTIGDPDFLLLHLEENKRNEIPPGCPTEVGRVMEQCWRWEPTQRPSFTHIHSRLHHISRSLA